MLDVGFFTHLRFKTRFAVHVFGIISKSGASNVHLRVFKFKVLSTFYQQIRVSETKQNKKKHTLQTQKTTPSKHYLFFYVLLIGLKST